MIQPAEPNSAEPKSAKHEPLDAAALERIFLAGRTHNSWQNKPVAPALLTQLYDLMKMAPTSANCSPVRLVFVASAEGKAKLLPHLMEDNRKKTETAPVCVILAYDTRFYELLPQLFPHNPDAVNWFAGSAEFAEQTAFRNSSLQGGYLMLAARALGLDIGAMSGFDPAGVDAAFFPDGRFRTNFLCNLGYGDPAGLFPRSPRLAFDDACEIV
ncbi:MAG: malonic semialdehyde reductase [Pseudomonadota bacterium]|nr:malonic semialdehyde reductase [Pseudomonadota bacterium]